jgi:signal transduction histidine kinase
MAVLETAQDITDTLRVTGMDRHARLELLARAVLDVGFSRCRIYTRGEGSARRLQLEIFAGGDIDELHGHEIDLENSHAASRRGQWEAGAAWFPPGYEREPWHRELGLPEDHQGWVDWPVFGPAGRLLGWIAADTAPPADLAHVPACDRARFVGREVEASDVEALRMYADHAAHILSASQDAGTVEFDREAQAISELDSRVLVSGATPTDAAEWLLEVLDTHLPGLVHSTVRYISDWTQSAVLFASRGPLEPYLEREVSLYDVRRPSGRVFKTGEPVVHRKDDEGNWSEWMRGWLDAGHPGFEGALTGHNVAHILIHPLQIENHLVGTLGLFLSERDSVGAGAAKWMVDRALERAQACATAARMQERLRSEAIEQAMPDLLPAIAHKLGTPLFLANREIRAFGLDVEEGSASVDSAREAMANLKRHMDKIDAIRRQFLEMATAGGRQRRKMDLARVLRDAVADATEGVCDEFEVDLTRCPDEAPAYASPEDISEVFYELAANAVRALDGRGVLTIEVSPYPGPKESPVAWRVTFENAGCIPEEDKTRIFDPFYTTNLASGTGLGLSLVRRLLRANQGSIREIGDDSVVFEVLVPTRAEARGGAKGEAQ